MQASDMSTWRLSCAYFSACTANILCMKARVQASQIAHRWLQLRESFCSRSHFTGHSNIGPHRNTSVSLRWVNTELKLVERILISKFKCTLTCKRLMSLMCQRSTYDDFVSFHACFDCMGSLIQSNQCNRTG